MIIDSRIIIPVETPTGIENMNVFLKDGVVVNVSEMVQRQALRLMICV